MALLVLAEEGLCISQIANVLLGSKMKLGPVALSLRINETECVAAETMHISVGRRNLALTHHNCDLVQRLVTGSPEVLIIL